MSDASEQRNLAEEKTDIPIELKKEWRPFIADALCKSLHLVNANRRSNTPAKLIDEKVMDKIRTIEKKAKKPLTKEVLAATIQSLDETSNWIVKEYEDNPSRFVQAGVMQNTSIDDVLDAMESLKDILNEKILEIDAVAQMQEQSKALSKRQIAMVANTTFQKICEESQFKEQLYAILLELQEKGEILSSIYENADRDTPKYEAIISTLLENDIERE